MHQALDVEPIASKRGWDMRFNDLRFTVKDASSGADKQILSGVSGSCAPGRLFALMGASGAGKTTLLDVLACNVYSGSLSGEVLVDGKPRDSRAFLKSSCYVMQKDLLYASATVRECVTTSALLRLPMTMPRKDKLARVEEVLGELELLSCADTLVGDEIVGIKGISGGQKRRVSLAIEMVKDPVVIFADEPTSGLDSEVALSIMDALRMLARKQRTVVCTIHQPNSDITDMFDDFMLLARGRCVYHGAWSNAVDWFALQGHITPTYKNPSDYFMSVIKSDEVAMHLADVFEASDKSKQFKALSPPPQQSSAAATTAAANHVAISVAVKGGGTVPQSMDPYRPGEGAAAWAPKGQAGSWFRRIWSRGDPEAKSSAVSGSDRAPGWYQVVVLYQRLMKNWLRSPVMLVSEFVQYLFISLFVGLMYHKFSDDADGVTNRAACIWFAFAIMSFTPSYTAVTAWHSERQLVSRELKQRQYGITPMYLARSLVTLPAQVLQCLVFVAIMYPFVGFQSSADKFFLFFIVLSMFQLISESLGLLCAIVTKHPTYAIIILTFALLLLLSFSGFLSTTIPVYFIWINKASYLTYAYTSLMQSQLEGLMVTDPENPAAKVDAISLLPSVLNNGLQMDQNIGILTSMWAFMELVKLTVLHGAHRVGLI